MEESRISTGRLRYIMGIGVAFLLGHLLLFYGQEMLLDRILCLLLSDVVFLVIFFLALMNHRIEGRLPQKQSASYQKVWIGVLISWGIMLLGMLFPNYFAPFILLGVLLSPALDLPLALAMGFYEVLLFGMSRGIEMTEMVLYLLLVICGTLLVPYVIRPRDSGMLFISVIYTAVNFLLTTVFYYMAYNRIGVVQLLFLLIESLLCSFIVVVLVPWLVAKNQQETKECYISFLEDTYPLVNDIRHFSMAEYNHGRRVSRLAGICTAQINGNTDCASMAGFYYRLGKMEGEPEIDNALRLANNHCFPKDVMEVMEEYGGIRRLPQTPESAIVHMVDALVTKIELLDKDTMSSTWNQDMVIYQTLNELSEKGIYDESGISINQFLKIRERLVQEDSLL